MDNPKDFSYLIKKHKIEKLKWNDIKDWTWEDLSYMTFEDMGTVFGMTPEEISWDIKNSRDVEVSSSLIKRLLDKLEEEEE